MGDGKSYVTFRRQSRASCTVRTTLTRDMNSTPHDSVVHT